jgi:hypothetical protein
MAFWTRTRRYLAALWGGAALVEVAALALEKRTDSSWLLLLWLVILVAPLLAVERTWTWLVRAPRKRWKRHDLEAAPAGGPGVRPPQAGPAVDISTPWEAPARGAPPPGA